jgi:molybdopterin-binding protein
MKLSARNVMKGTIKSIEVGAVNVEVIIEIAPGVEMTSIITKGSAESMGLEAGGEAYAVVKASNVMIGTAHSER